MLVLFDKNQNRDFYQVLEQLHDKIQFNFIIVHNKMKEEFESHYLDILGVKKNETPQLMIVMIQKKTVKYKYDGPFTVSEISKFLLDFVHHKLD